MADNAEIKAAAERFAVELARVAQQTRATIDESRATAGDRASILSNLLNFLTPAGPVGGVTLTAFIGTNPGAAKIARLAGARRLASEVYFRTQKELLIPGGLEKISDADPAVALRVQSSFDDLNFVIQSALSEEAAWGRVPEHLALAAMNEIFGGVLQSVGDLLGQLLKILELVGEAVLNLVDAAEQAAGVLSFVTRFALPVAIVIALVWWGPKLWKSRPS